MQICASGTVALGGFTLSFDYWNNNPGYITADAWGPSGVSTQQQVYTSPDVWHPFSITFPSAVNANYVGIRYGQGGNSFTGTMYIDNIQLGP